MNNVRLTNLLMIMLLLIPMSIIAQSSGKIAGQVTDAETGEGIPFANVFVEGTTLGAAADLEGNYVILNVPPGVYEVTASYVGFQKVTVVDVRVNTDFTTRVNFELTTGTVEMEAVVVQGERNPLIRKDLTNPIVSIGEESIQELPVDNIADIIKLQAGVVVGNDGGIHIRGGRSNEIAYTLNGVSLNDPYGNNRSIGLATNAVKEVSVSTGTFSAQYGNALSGVVNYVTKEGGNDYSFSIRSYAGEYFSGRDDLFTNIDDIDPLNRTRVEATLGGPLPVQIPFIDQTTFYASSVYEKFKGSLYGIRLYSPTDSYVGPEAFDSEIDDRYGSASDPYYFNPYYPYANGVNGGTGDGEFVAMNPSESFNFQGNMTLKFSPTLKIKYEAVYNQGEYKDYSASYKYNPDGLGTNYYNGLMHSVGITHTVSDNVFYTLKGSYGFNESEYYLYEDYDDPRYLPNNFSRTVGNTTFYSGGTSNYREWRKTTTMGLKGDMVAQLFGIHEVKLGFEARLHNLKFDGYSVEMGKRGSDGSFLNITDSDLIYDSSMTIIRRIPTVPSLRTKYEKEPMQLAAYIQDKIEFEESFILNAGLRYEMFDPAAQYNTALSQDLTEQLSGYLDNYLVDAEIKHLLSPRISMSYPITDRAIIRLSYGHFYQIGSLASLYRNDNYYVTNFASIPSFGNPNVDPQKSVQYEIGLQQQFTDDFKIDITGFYKDVSNYIYTQSIYTSLGRRYSLLTNLAYANSRGVTISFQKRRMPGSMFAASLDYTFSIAEGNRTEPSEELFFSEASGQLTETYLVPLSFDRSHVINGSFSISEPDDWNIGVILNLQTGTPYTPDLPPNLVNITYEQNSGARPINWNVNLKAEKYFEVGPVDLTVFVQVENLFDTENEVSVWASSGRALSNVEQVQDDIQWTDMRNRISRGDPGLFGMRQIDEYYSWRPERVNRPREIRAGFSIIFN